MKSYLYKNMNTKEIVIDEEAENYVKEKLGIPELIPKGEFGTYTKEQLEVVDMLVEWYFSGEWTKEELKDQEIKSSLQEELERADRIYEYNLERKMGLV